MMKRVLSFLLIMIIFLNLAACASENSADTSDNIADTSDNSADAKQEETVETEGTGEITYAIKNMPEFSTKDLDGNEVTDAIFADKDLTIVNFWGTFCGPCINEMPELATWELPENVQLIGIMVDVFSEDSEEFAMAQKIVEATGVTYQNLMISQDFAELYGELVGVPTTFFVDSEGKLVADPIVGANVPGYQKIVKDYLN